HAAKPVALPEGDQSVGNSMTELWHTRLGTFVGQDLDPDTGEIRPGRRDSLRSDLRTVRAIWCDDYLSPSGSHAPLKCEPIAPGNSCDQSLEGDDLPQQWHAIDIVALSSDLKNLRPSTSDFTPRAIPYSRFMLSSQGATLRLDGHWNPSNFRNVVVDE